MDAMSKNDIAALPEFPTVFARVSPSNKLKVEIFNINNYLFKNNYRLLMPFN